ncbi:hypothetical protein [Acinetobacter pollinis]|uniref:Lipoprotein n=1 Tax=Acinetobacter pollinis TaxID=2605270 RepID=A0ABU6DS63_9GAMM|nr:hypothetical protein [Acinetobacter pollinis]MEB5475969.1 hypothetical protein [Acinetobacter pollinis]
MKTKYLNSILLVVSILLVACSHKDEGLNEKTMTVIKFRELKEKGELVNKYNVIHFNDVMINAAQPQNLQNYTMHIVDKGSTGTTHVVIQTSKSDYEKYAKESTDASNKTFDIICKDINALDRDLDASKCSIYER